MPTSENLLQICPGPASFAIISNVLQLLPSSLFLYLLLVFFIMFRNTMPTMRTVGVTRSLATSAPARLRPRDSSSSSTSASQPVFRKDLPPAPAPPSRPAPTSFRSTPNSAASGASPTSASAPGKRDGGKPGSVYASYKALPYRTKLVFWTGGASKLPFPRFFSGLKLPKGSQNEMLN